MNKLYDLDDIHLIPRVTSSIRSRDEIKPQVELFPGVTLTVPIIAAPMMDVCNGPFARLMREAGGFGFIHRFNSIGEQVKEFYDSDKQGGCAIGAGDDFLERYNALYNAGCRWFCLDIANGASEIVGESLKKVCRDLDHVYWVVGNVASQEGYENCYRVGVCGIRVGIAGGGGCTTKNATGIYHPMASLMIETSDAKQEMMYPPKIIADGGINSPDRMCKALALGADLVMMGSGLAVTKESPAKKVNAFAYYAAGQHRLGFGEQQKDDSAIFRGSASFEVQKGYREPRYIEGKEVLLPYKGESLKEVIDRFMSGLRSSMSYFNARTLEEYRANVTYGVNR